MAYREPGETVEEVDPEAVAVAELRRRVTRVRTMIHVPVLLVGIFGAIPLYFLFMALQATVIGAYIPWLTGVCAFVPTFVIAFRAAPRLADHVVGRLLPAWRAQLASAHGLDPKLLEQITRPLE